MAKKTKKDYEVAYVLMGLLALICIGYSTYQTANGYELATGGLTKAWVIATIVSIGLVLCNVLLWITIFSRFYFKALIVGIFYLVIASFSFSANFNAFYSDFMKKELLYDELEGLQSEIKSIETRAIKALDAKPDTLKVKVELLKTTLVEQILDPGLLGYGPKAKKHVQDLNKVLDVELTIPAGSPRLIAESFSRQIDKLLKLKLESITNKSDQLKQKIISTVKNLQTQIDSARISVGNITDDKYIIEQCIKVHNQIGEEILSFTGAFRFSRLTAENVEIGKISHSFRSAFKRKAKEPLLVAVGLSSLIDLIVPVMIIVLTIMTSEKKRNKGISFPERRAFVEENEPQFRHRKTNDTKRSVEDIINERKNKIK